MYIQYRGFSVGVTSRIYSFHVITALHETREFTVEVQNAAFYSPPLSMQDGPEICYGRLRQELDRETSISPAEPRLQIGERDIQEYVERTRPRLVKHRGNGANL
jgi:hypothetical protein